MNPVPLFLIIVTLPLLLGGCGEKPVADVKPEEPVAETKPELEGVNQDELEEREGIYYFKDSDTPYTGKVYGLYENGQKKSEGNYKDGKPDGLRVWWHENGQKKSEVKYKDGKPNGLYVSWHKNGQKQTEGNFKDGNPDGLLVEWHDNGQKKEEANFKDGKPDGLYVMWHKNGEKKSEVNFKNGKLISDKYWNRKGDPVGSFEEAEAE